MKAWIVTTPGPVDGAPVGLRTVPAPQAGAGELLVRVLACGARGPGWLVAVALPLAPRPCPVSRRLGAFALGGASALPGLPLPVPPRGGSSRSSSRPGPAFSFRQGHLF